MESSWQRISSSGLTYIVVRCQVDRNGRSRTTEGDPHGLSTRFCTSAVEMDVEVKAELPHVEKNPNLAVHDSPNRCSSTQLFDGTFATVD